jgi:hypothetical protein
MLTAMPAVTETTTTGAARGAHVPGRHARRVLVVGVLLAMSCAVAPIPWLARAIGRGLRVKDPVLAGRDERRDGGHAVRDNAKGDTR